MSSFNRANFNFAFSDDHQDVTMDAIEVQVQTIEAKAQPGTVVSPTTTTAVIVPSTPIQGIDLFHVKKAASSDDPMLLKTNKPIPNSPLRKEVSNRKRGKSPPRPLISFDDDADDDADDDTDDNLLKHEGGDDTPQRKNTIKSSQQFLLRTTSGTNTPSRSNNRRRTMSIGTTSTASLSGSGAGAGAGSQPSRHSSLNSTSPCHSTDTDMDTYVSADADMDADVENDEGASTRSSNESTHYDNHDDKGSNNKNHNEVNDEDENEDEEAMSFTTNRTRKSISPEELSQRRQQIQMLTNTKSSSSSSPSIAQFMNINIPLHPLYKSIKEKTNQWTYPNHERDKRAAIRYFKYGQDSMILHALQAGDEKEQLWRMTRNQLELEQEVDVDVDEDGDGSEVGGASLHLQLHLGSSSSSSLTTPPSVNFNLSAITMTEIEARQTQRPHTTTGITREEAEQIRKDAMQRRKLVMTPESIALTTKSSKLKQSLDMKLDALREKRERRKRQNSSTTRTSTHNSTVTGGDRVDGTKSASASAIHHRQRNSSSPFGRNRGSGRSRGRRKRAATPSPNVSSFFATTSDSVGVGRKSSATLRRARATSTSKASIASASIRPVKLIKRSSSGSTTTTATAYHNEGGKTSKPHTVTLTAHEADIQFRAACHTITYLINHYPFICTGGGGHMVRRFLGTETSSSSSSANFNASIPMPLSSPSSPLVGVDHAMKALEYFAKEDDIDLYQNASKTVMRCLRQADNSAYMAMIVMESGSGSERSSTAHSSMIITPRAQEYLDDAFVEVKVCEAAMHDIASIIGIKLIIPAPQFQSSSSSTTVGGRTHTRNPSRSRDRSWSHSFSRGMEGPFGPFSIFSSSTDASASVDTKTPSRTAEQETTMPAQMDIRSPSTTSLDSSTSMSPQNNILQEFYTGIFNAVSLHELETYYGQIMEAVNRRVNTIHKAKALTKNSPTSSTQGVSANTNDCYFKRMTPQDAEFHFREGCKLLHYLLTNYERICEHDNGDGGGNSTCGHQIRLFLGIGGPSTLSSPLTNMASVLRVLKPRLLNANSTTSDSTSSHTSDRNNNQFHNDFDGASAAVVQSLHQADDAAYMATRTTGADPETDTYRQKRYLADAKFSILRCYNAMKDIAFMLGIVYEFEDDFVLLFLARVCKSLIENRGGKQLLLTQPTSCNTSGDNCEEKKKDTMEERGVTALRALLMLKAGSSVQSFVRPMKGQRYDDSLVQQNNDSVRHERNKVSVSSLNELEKYYLRTMNSVNYRVEAIRRLQPHRISMNTNRTTLTNIGYQHLSLQEAECHFQEACKLLDYLITHYNGMCEDGNVVYHIRLFLGGGLDASKRTVRARSTTLSSPLTNMGSVLLVLKGGSLSNFNHNEYDVRSMIVIQSLRQANDAVYMASMETKTDAKANISMNLSSRQMHYMTDVNFSILQCYKAMKDIASMLKIDHDFEDDFASLFLARVCRSLIENRNEKQSSFPYSGPALKA